jgi:hypothetical protein
MVHELATVPVDLGFLPPDQAIADPDHPGLLRAGPRAAAPYGDDGVEFTTCLATDLSAGHSDIPDLVHHGLDTVDLSGLEPLQAACARVLAAGRIEPEDAEAIRTALDGAELACASGRSVTVRFLAGEGFFMRVVGPDRMSMTPSEADGMNNHGGAASVHADQDVYGTPLVQLMDGRAPDLFRHVSPDGENHDADLMLVNLWIPLQQVVQPLVLADGQTIDRRRHQLRYGLPTTSFLERDQDLEINDIWSFLHDDAQRWYFKSDMDHRTAWMFNTLSTPHGAGVLPGEDVAARCVRVLHDVELAVGRGDAAALAGAVAEVDGATIPEGAPAPLRVAIERMLSLCESAAGDPSGTLSDGGVAWLAAAAAARQAVVRMSLELRLVVSVTD